MMGGQYMDEQEDCLLCEDHAERFVRVCPTTLSETVWLHGVARAMLIVGDLREVPENSAACCEMSQIGWIQLEDAVIKLLLQHLAQRHFGCA